MSKAEYKSPQRLEYERIRTALILKLISFPLAVASGVIVLFVWSKWYVLLGSVAALVLSIISRKLYPDKTASLTFKVVLITFGITLLPYIVMLYIAIRNGEPLF